MVDSYNIGDSDSDLEEFEKYLVVETENEEEEILGYIWKLCTFILKYKKMGYITEEGLFNLKHH